MADETPYFTGMTEEELWDWVEANPGLVNDAYDETGHPPLFAAACASSIGSLSLVLWMLNEMGADVNVTTTNNSTCLHFLYHVEILEAFLERGVNPIVRNSEGRTPLNLHVRFARIGLVVRLLQDSRVRASIDVQTTEDETPLHHVGCHSGDRDAAFMASLLLQAGANPNIKNRNGRTPLAKVQQERPSYHATIALLEQAMGEGGKTSLLVKARCLIVAAASSAAVPSYLQGRVARGEPLPRVTLTPLMGGQNDKEGLEDRELHTLLIFMFGMGGGSKGEGMPRDVFRLVMDMLMPAWNPLRRGVPGMELPVSD